MLRPLLALTLCASLLPATDGWPNIARILPPAGIELPEAEAKRLRSGVDALTTALAQASGPFTPDVAIFTMALGLALRHGEFYDLAKELPTADWALKQAAERLDQLASAPWTNQRGLVLRGYVSSLDDSVQPYGLFIPDELDLSKPVPLYVWLHGRSEKKTNLHFLHTRARSVGEIKTKNGIVLHAFGRYCVGFKHAGEIDILESIAHVKTQYNIDPDRVALMGYSMGGAGAKHLGAHYADHFATMHTGAGFAETRHYNNLKSEDLPWYEVRLWGLYDSPDYVRNLFNIPVIAYSGDQDVQMKANILLGEAYEAHGRKLNHLIAPGVGHKYTPEYMNQVMEFTNAALTTGRNKSPEQVFFQTKTLRYSKLYWVEALGLGEHWKDARVDAQADVTGVTATTSNITRLRLTWPKLTSGAKVTLDGQALTLATVGDGAVFVKNADTWMAATDQPAGLHKSPGLQGPIDDAFMSRFLVVLPSQACRDAAVDTWVKNESAHQLRRWFALMRGDARVKLDQEVTADDIATSNLILWGDATANSVTAKVLPKLPVQWDGGAVTVGTKSFAGTQHVPVCIYPNPLNPAKYVVLNSGLTFREAHDKTNSQQNPKLPDWAVIDIRTPASDTVPGKVVDAGFFDEWWQVR